MKRKPIITKVIMHEFETTGKKYFSVYYKNKNKYRNDRVRFYGYDNPPKSVLDFIEHSFHMKSETKNEETTTWFYN
jgi:hypothetical protein